jgi:hypothetical protein
MTQGGLFVLCVVGLPWWLGSAVLRALGAGPRQVGALLHAGAAWAAGAFLFAATLFVLVLCALPLDRRALVAAAILAAAGCEWLAWRRKTPANALPRAGSLEEGVFGACVVLAFACVTLWILQGNTVAIVVGDEATHWANKAAQIWGCGNFGESYAQSMTPGVVGHPEYPLMNPLLQVWAFVNAGRVLHVDNRLPIQAGFLALVLASAGALRLFVRPFVAALLLLAWLTVPSAETIARSAYCDAMVGLGFVLVATACLRLRSGTDRAWLVLLASGAAFLAWAKFEGEMLLTMLAISHLVPFGRRMRKEPAFRRGMLAALAAPLAVIVAQNALNLWHGFAPDLLAEPQRGGFFGRLAEQAGRHAPIIARSFAEQLLIGFTSTHLLFTAWIVGWLTAPRTLVRAGLRPLGLTLLLAIATFFVIYLSTYFEVRYHMTMASARLWLQLTPTVALVMGAGAAAVWGRLGVRAA